MTTSAILAAPTMSPSTNVKKQIRDINRLLTRPTLPADIRVAKERQLKALQLALQEQSSAQVERKMAQQYRMVKFFERKKAMRRVKQAQVAMEKAKDEKEYAAALSRLREARMDLNYIVYYPKDQKYMALYPTSETSDPQTLAGKMTIRKKINEKILAEAKVENIEEAPMPFEDDERDFISDRASSNVPQDLLSGKMVTANGATALSSEASDEDEDENDNTDSDENSSDDDDDDDDEESMEDSDDDSVDEDTSDVSDEEDSSNDESDDSDSGSDVSVDSQSESDDDNDSDESSDESSEDEDMDSDSEEDSNLSDSESDSYDSSEDDEEESKERKKSSERKKSRKN